jgi:hypothetical protein
MFVHLAFYKIIVTPWFASYHWTYPGRFLKNLQVIAYSVSELFKICGGWLIGIPFQLALIHP